MSHRSRIEALLFAADRPLSVNAIRRTLGAEDLEGARVRVILEDLRRELERRGGGFHLVEVAGGWEFRTREEYADDVLRLYNRRPATLSKAALETLAIITFRQPITRALIEELRGVDCSSILRTLLERDLIALAGRAELPGRPHLYRTTPTFLRVFGLRSLADLPNPNEIGELTEEHVLRLEDYRRQGQLGVDRGSEDE